jgi:hypothetical protein
MKKKKYLFKAKWPSIPSVRPSAARPSFPLKRPAAFRPLLTEGLALSGEYHFSKTAGNVIKWVEYVNQKNQILKIIFLSVKRSQMVSILDLDLLISIKNVVLRGKNSKTRFQEEVNEPVTVPVGYFVFPSTCLQQSLSSWFLPEACKSPTASFVVHDPLSCHWQARIQTNP